MHYVPPDWIENRYISVKLVSWSNFIYFKEWIDNAYFRSIISLIASFWIPPIRRTLFCSEHSHELLFYRVSNDGIRSIIRHFDLCEEIFAESRHLCRLFMHYYLDWPERDTKRFIFVAIELSMWWLCVISNKVMMDIGHATKACIPTLHQMEDVQFFREVPAYRGVLLNSEVTGWIETYLCLEPVSTYSFYQNVHIWYHWRPRFHSFWKPLCYFVQHLNYYIYIDILISLG